MTLQAILGQVPFEGKLTVSVWSSDWEEEVVRESREVDRWHDIGVFSEEVLKHRLAPVKVVFTLGSDIVIECKLKK